MSSDSGLRVHVALAMILGGALGNLYDRLFSRVEIPGTTATITRQVRDFIDLSEVRLKLFSHDLSYPWIFNLADVLLVAGVALLIVCWWVHRKDDRKTPAKGLRWRSSGPATNSSD